MFVSGVTFVRTSSRNKKISKYIPFVPTNLFYNKQKFIANLQLYAFTRRQYYIKFIIVNFKAEVPWPAPCQVLT
jgi:hypothetical protein